MYYGQESAELLFLANVEYEQLEKRGSSFWAGCSAAVAIGGYVAALVSVFNLCVRIFNLGISSLFTPVIEFWQKYVIGIIVELNVRVPWLIPDWPPDLYAVVLICTSILISGNDRFQYFDDRESEGHWAARLGIPVAGVLIFAIPYVNVIVAVFWMVRFWYVLTSFRFAMPAGLDPERQQSLLRLHRYLWGIIVGVVVVLLLNSVA
ncbi:MAG: hypothetical protein AB8G18_15195 [Gammaproteobacteria bacterium]